MAGIRLAHGAHFFSQLDRAAIQMCNFGKSGLLTQFL
jgi:hypothetical protein